MWDECMLHKLGIFERDGVLALPGRAVAEAVGKFDFGGPFAGSKNTEKSVHDLVCERRRNCERVCSGRVYFTNKKSDKKART